VNVSGTLTKNVRVLLDQDKLKTYKLSQQDIVNFISANDISLPGETVVIDDKQLTTRIISTIDSVDALKQLVVTVNPLNGEKVRLQDIADIAIVPQKEDTITHTNEKPSVLLCVLQKADANTTEVSKAFQLRLNELLDTKKFSAVHADVLLDQGDFIQRTIRNIFQSLVLGGVFAMLVLFLFLRSAKSPLIIGIAIPYSVIVTFVLMYFADFTLNMMTLGGLSLGIGMLVNNSIVVIENIYRHLSMGKDPKQAARDGVKEVGAAITASTLTTVAVFVPVVFITGLIGDLFTEFALTISFSLLASLFVALTVVRMLAGRWLKPPRENIEEKRQPLRMLVGLDKMVKWSLRHRAIVLFLAIGTLAFGLFGMTKVGMQFLPNTDEGFFSIRVNLANSSTLSETEKVVSAIEDELKKVKEIDTYVSLIGSTQEQAFRGTSQSNVAEIYVKMKDLNERDRSVFDVADDIKNDMEQAAKKANQTAEVSINLQSTAGSTPNTLVFNVKDTNEARLEKAMKKIYDRLSKLDEVNELTTDVSETVDEIQIKVDREKALAQGFTPAQVATMVNDMTRGVTATRMLDKESNLYNVNVEYDETVKNSVDNLKNLLIKKHDGMFIPLGNIADITIGKSPVQIHRIDQQNAVQFTLKYKNTTNLGKMSAIVDEEIAKLHLPEETEIVFGGDRELLESALGDLFLAFALAITFVFLVMAAQFESLKYPFVIMFTVPLMVIGVALGLTATKTPVSVMAIIGVIVLAGIVVNNAIVIVDYINQMKEKGLTSYEAIVTSVKLRVRPILMTALTTILGLLPLAFGIGEGAEMNQPLAITVIGGLISSTFLTLFVIPVV
jgi:hydrophobic/amphiphilic exporter-1 (mainly G- bacteria), HAE1 family